MTPRQGIKIAKRTIRSLNAIRDRAGQAAPG